jgi:hypothetical protein
MADRSKNARIGPATRGYAEMNAPASSVSSSLRIRQRRDGNPYHLTGAAH